MPIAPTIRPSTSSAFSTTSGTTLTLAAPTGLTNGDLILSTAVKVNTGSGFTWDKGIGAIASNTNALKSFGAITIGAKTASSESGPYTATCASAANRAATLLAIQGAESYQSVVWGSEETAAVVTFPQVTTPRGNCLLICGLFVKANTGTASSAAVTGVSAVVSAVSGSYATFVYSAVAPTAGTVSGLQANWGSTGFNGRAIPFVIVVVPPDDLPTVSVSAQLGAIASLSALVQPSVVANAQLGAVASLDAQLTVGGIPGVDVSAQLGAIASLSALVQPYVVVDAELGAIASLTSQLTVGGIPGVDVDAQLGAIANLTALVQPSVVANAQLGAVASLDAQLTVGGDLPLIAIANLGAIANLTALISPAPLPSAQWISLGKVYPLTNQWLRFPVASTGGQTFRIQFGNLGVSTVYWRSYGVLRPIYRDAQNAEFSGNGVKIYPSTERRALDLPIPPDLLAAGFTMRWFEVKKFFYRARYGSFSEPNWFVILEDLV